jgi:hypothetical protein
MTGLTRHFVTLSLLIAALTTAPAFSQPFTELTPQERSVLQPLSGEWDAMSATRKKKWRELADRYPKLSADEQQRISARMQGWSRMSPDDRRAARDQFRAIQGPQNAGPGAREQLKKQWQEYRSLPIEERQRLVRQGTRAAPGQGRSAETVKRAGTPQLPSAAGPAPLATRPAP